MMKNSAADLIHKYFKAYADKDRRSLENLLCDDFTFSSPVDDNIDRKHYFERCWPNCEEQLHLHIEKIFEKGQGSYVTYEGRRKDGGTFRNTEFFVIDHNKVKHVDVYFGSDSPGEVVKHEIRILIGKTEKACCAKNIDSFLKNYAPNIVAFDLLQPLQYQGREEVAKRVTEWFGSFAGEIDYQVQQLKISASISTAFCHSLNHVSGTTKQGKKIDMWWRATLGFEKLNDHWLVTHSHGSVPFDMKDGKALPHLKP